MATVNSSIREKIERIAGCHPSQHWLQDCETELRATGAANCTADAVLQQILHHDLRDVVREFPAVTVTENHPSFLLRRAIRDSMSAQHNYKSQLPASFRLLVQVEELLDVSQNAETRLSVGPASPNAPAPVGNQQARCLKLCLSDGYGPYSNSNAEDGMTFRPSDNDRNHQSSSSVFMAMEIEPIPMLSVNSKAGVKVLMRGPLQIRHGILLWQPVYRPPDANTNNNNNAAAATAVQQITVLGGCVQELVEIQAAALIQAKLVAGVGVDPTVRALIWNPETGETQEEDEGEGESRDLEPGAPPPLPVQQRQSAVPPQPQQRQSAVPPQPPLPGLPNTGANVNPPQPPPSRPTPVTSVPRRPQHQQSTSASNRNPYSAATSTSAPSNPYQSNMSTPTTSSSAASNPYQSGGKNSSSNNNNSMNGSSQNSRDTASGTARMRPPPRQQQQQQSSTRFNNDIEDIVMEDADPTTASNMDMDITPTTPAAHSVLPRTVAVAMPPPPASAATATAMHISSGASTNSTSGGGGGGNMLRLEAISLVELRNRLARARENEELYRQMFGQSFVVRARQKGNKLGFNIERIAKSGNGGANDGKKVKKYGYYMSAKFQDGTVNGDLVSCKISNEILEPFFSLPPSEMRKINREDRKRSEELIRNGGKDVQDALYQPRTYETTLLLSPDEFFRSESNPMPPLDGSIPILHLVKLCE